MKYIRTENSIYDTEKHDYEDTAFGIVAVGHKLQDFELILKQADTIEELCDVFVLDNVIPCLIHLSKTKGYYYYYGDSDKKSCLMPIYEEYKIYGAIWTDKGLIYVAKMNEEGELELL